MLFYENENAVQFENNIRSESLEKKMLIFMFEQEITYLRGQQFVNWDKRFPD